MPSLFGDQRLEPRARAELLESIVARSAERPSGRRPVLVFDLDGTLMDNRPRMVAILGELAVHWRDRHPADAERVARAKGELIEYELEDNLRLLGVDDEALLREGQEFWHRRFFVDDYLRHDVPMAGAVPFTRRCFEAGANLVYLTGRDLPNMALGTFASLRDLGFPIGVTGAELVTKPDFDTPDGAFKIDVAGELSRLGQVIAAFDNEPANCNTMLEAHPGCVSVLVDTLHAPDPPALLPDIVVVDSFET